MRTLTGIVMLAAWLWLPRALAHLPGEAEDGHSHAVRATDVHDVADAARERSGYARSRIAVFRQSGDDRELERAWRYLERDLNQDAPPYDTLVTAAYVVQAQHDFDGAMAYLHRAQSRQALTDEAWLLRASLHLLRGELEQGGAACQAISLQNFIARMFCAGRVASLKPDEAGAAYRKLVPLGHTLDEQPELNGWTRSVLGDLSAAAGDTETAITHYEQALAYNASSQVRAALVDQLIYHERWRDAWRHLQAPGQSLALHVRRYIVAPRVGQGRAVEPDIERADQGFRRWMASGDWLHAREMARFYLDVRPDEYLANRLARINYMLQKEPEDGRLVQRTSWRGHPPRERSIRNEATNGK